MRQEYREHRQLPTPLGRIHVTDLYYHWVDEEGHVQLSSHVRTEYSTASEWMSEHQAQELFDWQRNGFNGPPPLWMTEQPDAEEHR